jgi:proteasome lid subunit RPN8/RPN11
MNQDALNAARAHALAQYPLEACGIVIGGVYYPCTNVHETPETHFRIAGAERLELEKKGTVEAIIHSHPDGLMCPSQADMEGQLASGVTWGVMACAGGQTSDVVLWGGNEPIAPLIGRPFVHGIWDCYELIRDAYALGADALKEQGVTAQWPYPPIELPSFSRDDGWWTKGGDLYRENFGRAGFVEIPAHDARAGDVFLCRIHSEVPNHGGILVESDLLLHHLPLRVSRREGAGIWARAADTWLRYAGEGFTDAA